MTSIAAAPNAAVLLAQHLDELKTTMAERPDTYAWIDRSKPQFNGARIARVYLSIVQILSLHEE